MKELKPKLILPGDSYRRGDRSFSKFILTFLVAFLIGVFVGMKVDTSNVTGSTDSAPSTLQIAENEAAQNDEEPAEPEISSSEQDFSKEDYRIMGGENSSFEEISSEDPAMDPETQALSQAENDVPQSFEEDINLTDTVGEEPDQLANDDPKVQNEKPKYTLQVATFYTTERASISVSELRKKGYDAYSTPVTSSEGEEWQVVRVGNFSTQEEAEKTARILKDKENMPALLKKLEDDQEAGSGSSLNEDPPTSAGASN